ncbi:hypothetical protein KQX54_008665 [Cotesia glomerata]|uniref:Secreted protein n=1 Tax=Cotesia glomerata TaxID=32391 RepID=A0AAV7I0B9_COTGL|nr:hypothetical protein KQX54_008665 [Cotesia glomerata]
MQQRGSFTKAGMVFVRAAVLAAVITQLLGPSKATRPTGSHPGHAYFEQPCCGHSHLRHHKDIYEHVWKREGRMECGMVGLLVWWYRDYTKPSTEPVQRVIRRRVCSRAC